MRREHDFEWYGEHVNDVLVLNSIRHLLRAAKIDFREVSHSPTFTSEESANARGEPLGVGAKAIVMRVDDRFCLFVLPADRKLDSVAIKQQLAAKKTRFATPEELMELTGLVPGSVPPFGAPILPLELFADSQLGQIYDRIAFNAGSLTHSLIVPFEAWRAVAQPTCFAFSKQ